MVIHVHIDLNSKTFIVLMYTLVIVQKTKAGFQKNLSKVFSILHF